MRVDNLPTHRDLLVSIRTRSFDRVMRVTPYHGQAKPIVSIRTRSFDRVMHV